MYLALGLIGLVLFICLFWYFYKPTFEKFANMEPDVEEQVIDLYKELLQRQPTPVELKEISAELKNATLTVDGLQQRMIDSEEYNRIIKMQSNELAPELRKMLYEKKTLSYLARVYSESTANPVNPKFLLPLRDIFQYIEYNDVAMRMVLQSPLYDTFEEELLNSFQLNKELTIEVFERTFNKEKLMQEVKVRKVGQISSIQDPPPQVRREKVDVRETPVEEPSLLLTKPSPPVIEGFESKVTSKVGPAIQEEPKNMPPLTRPGGPSSKNVPNPSEDTPRAFESFANAATASDQDMTEMYQMIEKFATKIFDKDAIAEIFDKKYMDDLSR